MIGKLGKKDKQGSNFCHVSRIIPDSKVIPCVTSGIQKWKGAGPNFIIKDKVKIKETV